MAGKYSEDYLNSHPDFNRPEQYTTPTEEAAEELDELRRVIKIIDDQYVDPDDI